MVLPGWKGDQCNTNSWKCVSGVRKDTGFHLIYLCFIHTTNKCAKKLGVRWGRRAPSHGTKSCLYIRITITIWHEAKFQSSNHWKSSVCEKKKKENNSIQWCSLTFFSEKNDVNQICTFKPVWLACEGNWPNSHCMGTLAQWAHFLMLNSGSIPVILGFCHWLISENQPYFCCELYFFFFELYIWILFLQLWLSDGLGTRHSLSPPRPHQHRLLQVYQPRLWASDVYRSSESGHHNCLNIWISQ